MGLNGAKTLVLPGHLVLVIGHSLAALQTCPQALGRHGNSAGVLSTQVCSLGDLLWAAPELSLRAQQGPILSIFSLPTQTQEKPFLANTSLYSFLPKKTLSV